jgi:hypothetical protein
LSSGNTSTRALSQYLTGLGAGPRSNTESSVSLCERAGLPIGSTDLHPRSVIIPNKLGCESAIFHQTKRHVGLVRRGTHPRMSCPRWHSDAPLAAMMQLFDAIHTQHSKDTHGVEIAGEKSSRRLTRAQTCVFTCQADSQGLGVDTWSRWAQGLRPIKANECGPSLYSRASPRYTDDRPIRRRRSSHR